MGVGSSGTSLRHSEEMNKKRTFDPAPIGVIKEVERSDSLLSRSDSADSLEAPYISQKDCQQGFDFIKKFREMK
jgi:hypothetical protein